MLSLYTTLFFHFMYLYFGGGCFSLIIYNDIRCRVNNALSLFSNYKKKIA